MDFDTKAFNIILIIVQMTLIFQHFFFQCHTYACLNEKSHPNVFCEITKMELFIWN
jgi:hypothetical protein